jgi:hypothetical protein
MPEISTASQSCLTSLIKTDDIPVVMLSLSPIIHEHPIRSKLQGSTRRIG